MAIANKLEKFIMKEKSDFPTPEPNKNEGLGYTYFAISAVFLGISGIQAKFGNSYWLNEFDPHTFMTFRSLTMAVVGYVLMRQNNIELADLSTIADKKWFAVRTIGNYYAYLFFVLATYYVRGPTAQSLMSTNPAFVVFLSIFILKEKFYVRYVYGLVLCLVGTFLLVSNESTSQDEKSSTNPVMGVMMGMTASIITALLMVSLKVLGKLNIHYTHFWVGASNFIIGVVHIILQGHTYISFGFVLFSSLNGVVFYVAFYLATLAYNFVDVSKCTPLTYLQVITVFIFTVFLIGEEIFFTDVLGSLMILGYNVYNAYYPLK